MRNSVWPARPALIYPCPECMDGGVMGIARMRRGGNRSGWYLLCSRCGWASPKGSTVARAEALARPILEAVELVRAL